MPSRTYCRRHGRQTLGVSPYAFSANAPPLRADRPGQKPKWAQEIKPNPDTVKVIRRIEKGEGNDTIHRLTGKSVRNISKIRSQFHNGLYEL